MRNLAQHDASSPERQGALVDVGAPHRDEIEAGFGDIGWLEACAVVVFAVSATIAAVAWYWPIH